MITLRQSPEYVRWAAENLNSMFYLNVARTVTVINKGKIAGMMVYSNWHPHDAEVHIVSNGSKRWCSRKFLTVAFSYGFNDCKLSRVTGLVSANLTKILEYDQRVGFKIEGRCRDADGPGKDVIVLGFTRADWVLSPWYCDKTVVTEFQEASYG